VKQNIDLHLVPNSGIQGHKILLVFVSFILCCFTKHRDRFKLERSETVFVVEGPTFYTDTWVITRKKQLGLEANHSVPSNTPMIMSEGTPLC